MTLADDRPCCPTCCRPLPAERERVDFYVHGSAAPKGSMVPRKLKDGRVVVVHDNKRTKPWQRRVEAEARKHCREKWEAVKVLMRFNYARPDNHFRTDGTLRKGKIAPCVAGQKSATGCYIADSDKLVRPILDALTGIAYDDDKRVVHHSAQRYWVDEPAGEGVHVIVEKLA